ncbi:BLUF domain-containing protein [Sulfitobacter sp. JB4-11]|uniref:BLUF domain-containing protein n=1 Tax=Sulfitobacter rhodophyticola TaxID=3238304 RepID=UPI003513312E
MIRLVYFSTARADVHRGEVDRIVAHAVEKNRALGITGALGFNGRNFCQVLEGPDAAVHDLVTAIEADPRHSGFKILDEKEIAKPHFADWSMQLVDNLDFSPVINLIDD